VTVTEAGTGSCEVERMTLFSRAGLFYEVASKLKIKV